jgi:hypothetical protein
VASIDQVVMPDREASQGQVVGKEGRQVKGSQMVIRDRMEEVHSRLVRQMEVTQENGGLVLHSIQTPKKSLKTTKSSQFKINKVNGSPKMVTRFHFKT